MKRETLIEFEDLGLGHDYRCIFIDQRYGPSIKEYSFLCSEAARPLSPLVLEFETSDGEAWHGSFERGLARLSGVVSTYDRNVACVILDGQAYIFDVSRPAEYVAVPGQPVREVRLSRDPAVLIFVTYTEICGYGPDSLAWCTTRLSSDGITVQHVGDGQVRGYWVGCSHQQQCSLCCESANWRDTRRS